MKTIQVLEQLANIAHYNNQFDLLVNTLPNEIKKAFLKNDGELVKSLISNKEYFADEVDVAQI